MRDFAISLALVDAIICMADAEEVYYGGDLLRMARYARSNVLSILRQNGELAFDRLVVARVDDVMTVCSSGRFDARHQLPGHTERVANRGYVVRRQRVTCGFGFDEMAVNSAPIFRPATLQNPRKGGPGFDSLESGIQAHRRATDLLAGSPCLERENEIDIKMVTKITN